MIVHRRRDGTKIPHFVQMIDDGLKRCIDCVADDAQIDEMEFLQYLREALELRLRAVKTRLGECRDDGE